MKAQDIVNFIKRLVKEYGCEQFPNIIFINIKESYATIGNFRGSIDKELLDKFVSDLENYRLFFLGKIFEIVLNKERIVFRTIKVEDGKRIIRHYLLNKGDEYSKEKFVEIFYDVEFKSFADLIMFVYERIMDFDELGFTQIFSGWVRMFYSKKDKELYFKFHKSGHKSIKVQSFLKELRKSFKEAIDSPIISFYYDFNNYSDLVVVGNNNEIIKYTYDYKIFKGTKRFHGLWFGG